MKISGNATLAAPVEQVWAAILDPAVLARSIPGCQALTALGDNRYAMTVSAGVAAIKGTYDGQVALSDLSEPNSLTMKANGSGAPGTIDADVKVRLEPSPEGGTSLSYDADAAVGGAIGGVGQRMLAGVTKKMAGQFFSALDADIAGVRPTEAPVESPAAAGRPGATVDTSATPVGGIQTGQTFSGTAAAPGAAGGLDKNGFAAGVAVGGVLALIGVVVGAAIRGRR